MEKEKRATECEHEKELGFHWFSLRFSMAVFRMGFFRKPNDSGGLGLPVWVNPQYLLEQGNAGVDCMGSGRRISTSPSVHRCPDLKTQLGNESIASGAVLG